MTYGVPGITDSLFHLLWTEPPLRDNDNTETVPLVALWNLPRAGITVIEGGHCRGLYVAVW